MKMTIGQKNGPDERVRLEHLAPNTAGAGLDGFTIRTPRKPNRKPVLGYPKGFNGYPLLTPVLSGTEFIGTTNQLCGLNPLIGGSGVPQVGVPFGPHLFHGSTVCFDPFLWREHGFVPNSSVAISGQAGTGKSAAVKRLILGTVYTGTRFVVCGDVKPDYVKVCEAVGGQVISLGAGGDRINPLDFGVVLQAVERLNGAGHTAQADEMLNEARTQRLNLVTSLAETVRQEPITEREQVILIAVLEEFDRRAGYEPLFGDIIRSLERPSEEITTAARSLTADEFRQDSRGLIDTLDLLVRGPVGGLFDERTSVDIDLNAPGIVIDISALGGQSSDGGRLAAAMIATWAISFRQIDASLALAHAGLAPLVNTLVVIDECWQALQSSPSSVKILNSLTRTNRQKLIAPVFISHSYSDFEAFDSVATRNRAIGIMNRCSTKLFLGMDAQEVGRVEPLVSGMTEGERECITSWNAPADLVEGERAHPGAGKVMLFPEGGRGIPFSWTPTRTEKPLYETSTKATVAQRAS